VGGALGGAFNVLVAPVAFNSHTELPLVLLLVCFLRPIDAEIWKDPKSGRKQLLAPVLLGLATFGALFAFEGKTAEQVVFVAAGLSA
jgi:hypothetical protein